uniref:Per os infectivity factor 1 n=1 Tax=Helicoverpa armigera nucleopolyhedrovirus TaxID=51313 RepID=A0A0E3GIC7_9ABAC|nr:per os infectivity factor 1 [Helicoverpa armigera nucleopolyhedrovirus]
MYATLVIVLLLVAIILIIIRYTILLQYAEPLPIHEVHKFDNGHVPPIEIPGEINIDSNPIACHKQLTKCTTHMDCDLCREGLANCQYFDEQTKLIMRDEHGNETEHIIYPGEAYCLALDRNRARSCNANTGTWILAQSETGFTLLCSCLSPGAVTQLNLYEDCNVPVGCQPHGTIIDINERPLRCDCETGYVPDYNDETETPYCRPLLVRDMYNDTTVFPRAPCPPGYVQITNPNLNPEYAREFALHRDICVVDPCSVDFVSGLRTNGRLSQANRYHNQPYCDCSNNGSNNNTMFSIYSVTNAVFLAPINQHAPELTNACIEPFNVRFNNANFIMYKHFWAHDDVRSDDEVVCHINPNNTLLRHNRYLSLTYPSIVWSDVINGMNYLILKFSIAFAVDNIEQVYRSLSANRTVPCFAPGVGRCIVANPNYCIRRHANFQVWTAETFSNSWCIFSRENNHIRSWHPSRIFPDGRYPSVFRIALNQMYNVRNTNSTCELFVISGHSIVLRDQFDNLRSILGTYPNYSTYT